MLDNTSVTINDTPIFTDVSLHPKRGEWVSILGRSGCGKSTLLRLLAKLEVVGTTTGTLTPPAQVAWMGQSDLLHDWATVLQNVILPQRIAGRIQPPHITRAKTILDTVGLGDKYDAYPYELSGGQRQRVALVRTLMTDAPVVLMDEPFCALDSITKDTCQTLFHKMLAQKTVIMVTHDCMEALRLSDTIMILNTTLQTVWQAPTPAPRMPTDPEVISGYNTIWNTLTGHTHDTH